GSRTPLVEAIVHGHYFAARSILKAGASVDVLDSQGRTALHWAALFGGREIAQLLIHHGANATIYDSEGRNVVHLGTLNRKSTLGFLLKELLRRTTACKSNSR
ncbi:ankyrin repeat-containing domain protein, partial [Cladochytrium replicatum]